MKLYENSVQLLLVRNDYLNDSDFLSLFFAILAVNVVIMSVICRKNMSCYIILNIYNICLKKF